MHLMCPQAEAITGFCRATKEYCPPGPQGHPGIPGSKGNRGDVGMPVSIVLIWILKSDSNVNLPLRDHRGWMVKMGKKEVLVQGGLLDREDCR